MFEKTGSTSKCETLFLEAEAPSEMAAASCCVTWEHFCKPFQGLEDRAWGFQMAGLFGEPGASTGLVEIHHFSILSYASFAFWLGILICMKIKAGF